VAAAVIRAKGMEPPVGDDLGVVPPRRHRSA
jgi:hypothetical protein